MTRLLTTLLGVTALVLALSGAARADGLVLDPANDFLSTYAGPHGGDLDVLSVQATLLGANFNFSAALGAPVGTTAGGFYVFGVDRGQGTARFGVITNPATGATYDATHVLFDSVIVFTPGTSLVVRDLLTNAATNLPLTNVTISGTTLSLLIPAGALPSTGFSPDQYTFNLWPRFSGAAGNLQISDFAPDNSNAPVQATPEPATLLLLGTGLASIAGARRRRRKPVIGDTSA